MLNTQNIYVILFALPIYQLLFYTVQLVTFRKKANRAIFPVGLLVGFMTLFLIMNAIFYLGYDQTFSYLYPFYIPVLLLILPTLYLFFQSVTGNFNELEIRRLIVLYLPSLFILILNYASYGILEESSKIIFLASGFHIPDGIVHTNHFTEQVFWLGNVGFMGGQLVLTLIKTYRIAGRVGHIQHEKASYLPYLRIDWLWIILVSVFMFTIGICLMNIFTPKEMIWVIVFNVVMLISGAFTGYFGLKQYQLYKEVELMPLVDADKLENRKETGDNPEKFPVNEEISKKGLAEEPTPLTVPSGINLDADQIRKIIKDIRRELASEKLYLNPKLSIQDLAHHMHLSRRALSFIINEAMQTNYYGLVNEFRVMEAKEILRRQEYNRLTIEAIANMCGFQSKSSFNACFKKMTGLTPSEFKNDSRNKKAGN